MVFCHSNDGTNSGDILLTKSFHFHLESFSINEQKVFFPIFVRVLRRCKKSWYLRCPSNELYRVSQYGPLYIKVVEGQIAFSVNIGHWKDEGLLLDHLFGSLFIRQCYSRIVFNSPIGPHAKSTLLSQTIWPEYFRTKANSIWSICKFQNMYYAQVHLHYILIFEIHLSLQLAGFMNPFTVPVQSCRTLDCILDEMFHIKRIRLIH